MSGRRVRSRLAWSLLAVVGTAGSATAANPPASRAHVPATWADVQALPAPPPALRVAYGRGPKQFGELRVPAGRGPHPVAILLHGGCWQSEYTLDYMKPLAARLARDGIATWNVEYRGIGDAGGGWPGTFQDVVASAATLQSLAASQRLDPSRVVVVGHSAGGHLALWLAAKRRPAVPGAKRGAAGPALRGVVALAGIADLRDYAATAGSCNQSVVPLLGGTALAVPGRYAATSPAELLPIGVPMRLILGSADPIVTQGQEERFAAASRAAGDRVDLSLVPGEGHFDLVLPTPPASARVEAAIHQLLRTASRN